MVQWLPLFYLQIYFSLALQNTSCSYSSVLFYISDLDSYYSIGGSKFNEQEVWRWITGETWDYENFAEDQPDGRYEYCLKLHYPSMTWHDVFCVYSDLYYICE